MAPNDAKRFIMWDAHFLDGRLGADLYERFGSAGVTLFLAFVCGCKRNLVPGRIKYGSDLDLLAQLGLDGLQLVNEHGDAWTVDAFWTFLGERKQTRRTRSGRLTNVISTRWERWQKDWQRDKEREKKRRSRAESAGDTGWTESGQAGDENRTDTDTDTEINPTSEPDVSEDARRLTRQFAEGVVANRHKVPAKGTKANAAWLLEMDRLLRIDGADPAEVERVIAFCVNDHGDDRYPGEAANVRSVAKLRERFGQLLAKANKASNVRHIHAAQDSGVGELLPDGTRRGVM